MENFGYIEPGRGAKGKQRWLASAENLEDMYRVHHGKEILLWCNVLIKLQENEHTPPMQRRKVKAENSLNFLATTNLQIK